MRIRYLFANISRIL